MLLEAYELAIGTATDALRLRSFGWTPRDDPTLPWLRLRLRVWDINSVQPQKTHDKLCFSWKGLGEVRHAEGGTPWFGHERTTAAVWATLSENKESKPCGFSNSWYPWVGPAALRDGWKWPAPLKQQAPVRLKTKTYGVADGELGRRTGGRVGVVESESSS